MTQVTVQMRTAQMQIAIRPMSRSAIEILTSWRYEAPYDIYDMESAPSAVALRYFEDPRWRYHEIQNADGELIGFCSFGEDGQVPGGDYRQEALDIGMGVRPDLTGRGLGATIAAAVVAYALEQYAPVQLRVTIAAFNQRAQRVWKKLGFREVQSFGRDGDEMPFVVLTLDPSIFAHAQQFGAK